MKRIIKSITGCVVFIIILTIVLTRVNSVMQPKYYLYNSNWPSTSTFRQFYEMDRNSIDVLFLGSSVAVNNFIPQQLYNNYGIRSYNLASEQQSIILSYYWLKEALRFQTPRIVVIEPYFLQDLHPDMPINTTEGLTRKAIDPMHMSKIKMEAARDICERDPDQTTISYYLTNFRYHMRWKDLSQGDFISDKYSYPRLFGWAPGREGLVQIEPFEESDEDKTFQFRDDMVEYLEKMVQLCNEKGIKLIMVKIPQGGENIQRIDYAYRQLAEQYGLDYYNFREKSLYEKMNIDPSTERVQGHGNLYGNYKNSALLGKILKENYNLPTVRDPQYEETRGDYEYVCTSFSLTQIVDIDEYLHAVNRPNFIVMISVKDEAVNGLKDSTKDILTEIGLTACWDKDTMYRHAYYAVIKDGTILEKQAKEKGGEPITTEGSFNKLRNHYTIKSAGYEDMGGSYSSIIIDGKEYSLNSRGLNIVVYDKYLCKVVDSVCFDTYGDSSIKR